jgi:hypothetical protein
LRFGFGFWLRATVHRHCLSRCAPPRTPPERALAPLACQERRARKKKAQAAATPDGAASLEMQR